VNGVIYFLDGLHLFGIFAKLLDVQQNHFLIFLISGYLTQQDHLTHQTTASTASSPSSNPAL